jgi:LmbE family N-acetylglucosaminyl deacetylase
MRAALLISPHLDDAMLSAGQFIAGRPDTVVLTVLAGTPKTKTVLTSYDAKTGFKSAAEAMEARRAEDVEALALLHAKPLHLDFLDSQYGQTSKQADITEALRTAIDEHDPEFVVGPLGLVHPDHILVREALLEAMKDAPMPLYIYEDLPARVVAPEAVTEALRGLNEAGYEAELEFIGDGPLAAKLSALWAYRSQMTLPEFENTHVLLVAERFWKVSAAVAPEEQARD